MMGGRFGGQKTPTSLTEPLPEEPVLLPIFQPSGRPAARRLRLALVAPSTEPAARDCAAKAHRPAPVAAAAWPWRAARWCRADRRVCFRSDRAPERSRRVTSSPSERANAVKPCGPPSVSRIRLGGGVVAQGDGRVAQLGQRHAVLACLWFGDGRVFDQRLALETDASSNCSRP